MGPRPEVEVDVEIGEKQRREFREQGFTSVGRITSDEEVAWLRELYDELFESRCQQEPLAYFDLARPYESPGPDLLPQILAPERLFPELRRTACFRNAHRLSAALLDCPPEELIGWGHMIRKPPRVGAALPWHQDEAYWDPRFDFTAVGVWMPLDEATTESGCLHFLPGSHRGPVRPHRHVGSDPRVHALVTDDVDDRSAVAVPLPAGGASFHHPRLLHRSGPNRSDGVRRAWANEFQRKPLRRDRPYERPWVAEGRAAWDERRPR